MVRLKVNVSVSLPYDLVLELEELRRKKAMNRSEVVTWLLYKGLRKLEQDTLVEYEQVETV